MKKKIEITKTPHPETLVKVAKAFCDVLKEWLTPRELKTALMRNKTPKYQGCDAVHDFCDANQAMLDAFVEAGLNCNPNGADVELYWDSAWHLARQFGYKKEAVTLATTTSGLLKGKGLSVTVPRKLKVAVEAVGYMDPKFFPKITIRGERYTVDIVTDRVSQVAPEIRSFTVKEARLKLQIQLYQRWGEKARVDSMFPSDFDGLAVLCGVENGLQLLKRCELWGDETLKYALTKISSYSKAADRGEA